MVAEIEFRAVFAGSYTAICAFSGRATTTNGDGEQKQTSHGGLLRLKSVVRADARS